MTYHRIKLGIKNMKGSAIENHVSEFFMKFPSFFQRFIINLLGFLVLCPFTWHRMSLIWFCIQLTIPTVRIYGIIFSIYFNTYNGGKKYLSHQFVYPYQKDITVTSNPTMLDLYVSYKILIINSTKASIKHLRL